VSTIAPRDVTEGETRYLRRVLRYSTPGDWRPIPIGGGIVVLDSSRANSDELDYYGGKLVCESINPADALAVCSVMEMAPRLLAAVEYSKGYRQ
jgi:hypothetical protein